MAKFLKNTVEAPESGVDSPAQAVFPPRADHLSADAVSLEVPIRIHGSRVNEVAPGSTPHTEPFEEQTITMIVFPSGAVLRMSTPVSVGQMLVLTNLKSQQDAICRVVKVRTYSNLAGYVEVEFTNSVSGYWGVDFAPDDLGLPKKMATLGSENSMGANHLAKEHSSTVPASPLDASASVPAREQSPVVGGVSRITVVRPESAPLHGPAISKNAHTGIAVVAANVLRGESDVLTEKPVLAVVSSDSPKISSDTADWRAQDLTAGLDASPMSAPYRPPSPAPGAIRDAASVSAENAKPWQDGRVLAAGIGLAVVLAVGGFFWKHSAAPDQVQATASVVPAPIPTTVPASGATANPVAVVIPPVAVPPAPARISKTVPSAIVKPQATVAKAPATEARQPSVPIADLSAAPVSAATKEQVRDVTSDLFGSLNAHPVAGRRQSAPVQPAAPTIEAAPSVAGVTTPLAIPSPSSSGLPSPVPSARPRTNSVSVSQPRLLFAQAPSYPAAAKQTRTEGDVLLDVLIDQTGKVADAQAVSGPLNLRQAAIDAVRQWKYAPSTVNGQSTTGKLTVVIKFRL